MLIAERLLLLDRTLDGQVLVERATGALNRWLASACLVELAALGRLGLVGGKVVAPEDVPAHYMMLSDAQAIVRKRSGTPMETLDVLTRAMPRMAQDLLESMTRRGLLIEEQKRKFGFLKSLRYPVQSTSAYRECAQLLSEAAEQFGVSDLWNLGFLLLADGMELPRHHLPEQVLNLDARLNRFEAFVSSQRANLDPSAQRARLIFALTKLE
jgi:hypothetical protein